MFAVREGATGESGLLLLLFLVVSCASCSLTGPGDTASLVAELDARIPAVIAAGNAPSTQVVVVHRDRIVWSRAFGENTGRIGKRSCEIGPASEYGHSVDSTARAQQRPTRLPEPNPTPMPGADVSAKYIICHDNADDANLCGFVDMVKKHGIQQVHADINHNFHASEVEPRHIRAAVVLKTLLTREGVKVDLGVHSTGAIPDFAVRVNQAMGELAARAAHAGAAPPSTEQREATPPPAAAAPDAGNPLEQARQAITQAISQGSDALADVTPPQLTEDHLRNSRILPSRDHILNFMPKGGVCAEVGTQTGCFAKQILNLMSPSELHLYDCDFTPFDESQFQSHMVVGRVRLHEGDSSSNLAEQPDKTYDFIYVDGDHSYEGVVRDLDQAIRKVKPDGWIVCNDYTLFSPIENTKYGVYRAVNELCLEHDWEIVYMGLHRWGYHDVALRKRR